MEQPLSQYKIFYEVAKTGNISKAAKELYISQPAISKAIGKLEDSLGVALFVRNSRGVQLTDEGEVMFRHAQAAFEALSLGERELRRIQELNIGHIRIGVSNTLCKHLLLPYLRDFIQEYPHIKVTIECQSSIHTLEMLKQQHIDIGLVAQPQPSRGLTFLPVTDIEDIFAATPCYLENLRLREGEDADALLAGNIMLLDRNNITRQYIDEYMEENRIEANNLLEVTNMDLLIEFTRIGLGIGCVIKEFVQEDLDCGRLAQLVLAAPIHKRTIGFVYRSHQASQALGSFLSFCQSRAAG